MSKGAVIMIVDALDRLLLLKRHPVSVWMPEKWGLPGGRIEPDETPESAAIAFLTYVRFSRSLFSDKGAEL